MIRKNKTDNHPLLTGYPLHEIEKVRISAYIEKWKLHEYDEHQKGRILKFRGPVEGNGKISATKYWLDIIDVAEGGKHRYIFGVKCIGIYSHKDDIVHRFNNPIVIDSRDRLKKWPNFPDHPANAYHVHPSDELVLFLRHIEGFRYFMNEWERRCWYLEKAKRFEDVTDLPRESALRLLKGELEISEHEATCIQKLTGVSAEFWMKRQRDVERFHDEGGAV
ncbi:MAG: hypothetical protein AAF902_01110 [Chloroflexota bacterium]